MKRTALATITFAAILLASNSAYAETAQAQTGQMSWAIGAGLAGASFPAYRGSSVREFLALPIPTLSVTTDRIKLDRKGARLSLFELGPLSIRLSASGSLPVNSDDVPLRAGMPDLDSSLEFGPVASLKLPCFQGWQCHQETLLRNVIATDLRHVDAIGWTLQPRISLKSDWIPTGSILQSWRVTAGPLFATRRYHDYFYRVDAEFATPDRPEYEARSGYSGWRTSLSYNLQRGRLGLSSFVSYDDLHDTSFNASPLLEAREYLLAGLLVRWEFFRSKNYRADNDSNDD